jgi:hypothetical protein
VPAILKEDIMVAAAERVSSASLEAAHLFDMRFRLGARLEIGAAPDGRRLLLPAGGGSFEGARLRGEVLAHGGDWALLRADGGLSLDIRLVLKTDDGALIFMNGGGRFVAPPEVLAEARDPHKRGGIDPGRYYFRTPFQFETGAKGHAWLNDIVCIGKGRLVSDGAAYAVFAVL